MEYSEDTQRIENFLLQFLNSDPTARAKLTTQGDGIAPKIAESLKDAPSRKWSSVSVASIGTVANVYKEVKAVIRRGLDAGDHTFYLKPAGDSFLVDWEATTGYWPIPFKTFKALGCNKPITIRAVAEISDYFNFGYEKDKFVSVELEHLRDGRIHGYVHHRHEACPDLVNLLYDGKPHRVMVDIFPMKGETSCVTITNFVSDSWVKPDDKTEAEKAI